MAGRPRKRTPFTTAVGRMPRRRRGFRRTGGTSPRKQAYMAYIRSPAWRAFRVAWWAEYDAKHPVRKCYCCGRPQSELSRPLELHHRTYERLGAEEYGDLVAVCKPDHDYITKHWRARGKTGLAITLWELTDRRRDMVYMKGGIGG